MPDAYCDKTLELHSTSMLANLQPFLVLKTPRTTVFCYPGREAFP